ncbi:hypothetical protein GGI35DRAFT_483146 [Trichoderma velutinum]
MTTAASAATEAPAWELRLRGAKAQIQESQDSIDITEYLVNPGSFSIDHQSLSRAEDGIEELKQRAGKLREHLTLLRSNSPSDKFKPIIQKLINNHQELSNDLKAVTDRLQNDRVDKRTALERVKEAHQRAKKQSNDGIERAFEDAINVIHGLPYDLQEAAADAWVLISDQFIAFANKLFNAFSDIVSAIAQWPANVWGKVKGDWNTVKGIFENIWQWFNHLSG